MNNRIWNDPQQRRYEDFAVGDVVVTRGRTVDTADINAFAGLTGDYYPLHVDEEYAKGTRFGTRLAHGPLTFAIAVGLVGMSGFYGDAIVSLVEIKSLKVLKPVKAGDTLRVRAEVVELTAGEKSNFGTLHVRYSVRNQKEEEVMSFLQIMLAQKRALQGEVRG